MCGSTNNNGADDWFPSLEELIQTQSAFNSCCVLCNLCNVLNHAVAVHWDIWKIWSAYWFSIHINVFFFFFWSMRNDVTCHLLNPPLSFSLPLVSLAAFLRTKMCQLLKCSAPPPHSYNEVATMGTHLQLPPVTSPLGIPPPAVLWSYHDQEVFWWPSEHQFSATCSHGLYSVTIVFPQLLNEWQGFETGDCGFSIGVCIPVKCKASDTVANTPYMPCFCFVFFFPLMPRWLILLNHFFR